MATAWSAGAGKFANSGVGTIAFGALSGGVGAELAGGNFWQGAVTGGIVAGLNHVMHQMNDEYSNNEDVNTSQGEGDIVNWFDPEKDPELYNHAKNDTKVKGVVKVYTHGAKNGLQGPDGKLITNVAQFSDILKEYSPMWKNFVEQGGNLKLVLKSCLTGFNYSQGFAKVISCAYNNLTVIGPSQNYRVNAIYGFPKLNWEYGVINGGTWNAYYNGILINKFKGQ